MTKPLGAVGGRIQQVSLTASDVGADPAGAAAAITLAGLGGTTVHSALSNLDYASAGHTGFAPINAPTFTGIPSAPTAAVDTNTTQLATCAYVVAQASGDNPLINGTAAPGTSKRYSRTDHIHPTDTTRVGTSRTVNGHALSADVTVSATDVGLGNCDNTSDANKPVSTAQAAAISALVPPGCIQMYGGASAPTGWVLCDGASYLRAGTYANLYAVIGTTFGSADGTHFNVPNMCGRAPIGVGTGTGLTARALGATVGEETHLLTSGESGVPQHYHNFTWGYVGNYLVTEGIANSIDNLRNYITNWQWSMSNTGYSTAANASSYHNNMQPSLALNFIIKI